MKRFDFKVYQKKFPRNFEIDDDEDDCYDANEEGMLAVRLGYNAYYNEGYNTWAENYEPDGDNRQCVYLSKDNDILEFKHFFRWEVLGVLADAAGIEWEHHYDKRFKKNKCVKFFSASSSMYDIPKTKDVYHPYNAVMGLLREIDKHHREFLKKI